MFQLVQIASHLWMRKICAFLRLRERASGLVNPFAHSSQARTQVLLLQTCADLCRLASPFGQGFKPGS